MAERRSGKMNSMEISSDNLDFEPRMRRPLIRQYPPLKTTIVSGLLFIGGLIFLSLGLSILFSRTIAHTKDRGIAMIVLGGIMFIPGSYGTLIIYGTWKGWSGYDYSLIPSYDD